MLTQPETVESSRSVCHQSQLRSVEKLSDTERDALVSSVKVAQEVAVCLVYTDGSSQLREQTDNKVSHLSSVICHLGHFHNML